MNFPQISNISKHVKLKEFFELDKDGSPISFIPRFWIDQVGKRSLGDPSPQMQAIFERILF